MKNEFIDICPSVSKNVIKRRLTYHSLHKYIVVSNKVLREKMKLFTKHILLDVIIGFIILDIVQALPITDIVNNKTATTNITR